MLCVILKTFLTGLLIQKLYNGQHSTIVARLVHSDVPHGHPLSPGDG